MRVNTETMTEGKSFGYPDRGGLLAMVGCSLVACCLLLAGCDGNKLQTRVVHGRVTCGGQEVPDGYVCFVPIEGTPGSVSNGTIVQGQYRIDARGGVPVGKHRVEVRAMRKTGQKALGGRVATERAMMEEIEEFGAPEYNTPQSPLIKIVPADGDGRIDIEIPPRKK